MFPDVQTFEVRVHGVWVSDALHQRHLAGVEELLDAGHHRVEADLCSEREHLVSRDPDRRASLKVGRVGVRHDGVEPVVATAELKDDQHMVVVDVVHRRREHGLGEDRRHDDADTGCGDAAHHEVASGDHLVWLT